MNTDVLRAGALAFMVSLTACDDGATAPESLTEDFSDDVALLAADAAQEDLEVMNTLLPSLNSAGDSYALGGSVSDFTRSRTVTFYDAEGAEQDSYDPLLTASIHTLLELSGERSRDRVSFTVERNRDLRVTGLAGEETERTWNGEGSEDRSRIRIDDGDAVRSYTFSGSVLVEDVVRGVPRSENPWPLSGRITRSLSIERTTDQGTRTLNREVVITFDGTSTATLTVDGQIYDLDLASRTRDRVRRRDGRR